MKTLKLVCIWPLVAAVLAATVLASTLILMVPNGARGAQLEAKTFWDARIPAVLRNNPEEAKEIGGKYQMNIGVDSGGEWFIDLSDSGPSAQRAKNASVGADGTISMSTDDFNALLQDPNGMGLELYFQGKLKVTGDPTLLTKLQRLLCLERADRGERC